MSASGQHPESSSQDALQNRSMLHPELNYLAPKVLDYQSGITLQTTEQFQRVDRAYDGRAINPDSVQHVEEKLIVQSGINM